MAGLKIVEIGMALPIILSRNLRNLLFVAPGKISNLLRLDIPGRHIAAAMGVGSETDTVDRLMMMFAKQLHEAGDRSFIDPLPPADEIPRAVRSIFNGVSDEQIDKVFHGEQDQATKTLETRLRLQLSHYHSLPQWVQQLANHQVPAEIVQSVLFKGKLLDGREVTELSNHWYQEDLIVDAGNKTVGHAMGYGIAAMAMTGAVLLALQMISGFDMSTVSGVTTTFDTFNPAVTQHAAESVKAWGTFWNGLQGAVMAVLPMTLAPTIARSSRRHYARAALSRRLKAKVYGSRLHLPVKESKVEYEQALPELDAYRQSLIDQAEEAYRNRYKPLIELGISTGLMRGRGFSAGLESGVPYLMNLINAYQNTIVFGGTGSGKTQRTLLPIMRQIFRLKAAGELANMGWFVTDSKAVLWQDVLAIAIQEGFGAENVIVIGSEEGNYGCNITKGVSPVQLTTWIDTIARMSGRKNEGGSGFYKSMSGYWGTQFANIAWAYSHSQGGLEHQRKTGCDPYCLSFIFEIATDDALLDKVITELTNEIVHGSLVSDIVGNADLINAMRLVNTKWQDLEAAKETKTNIQATLISDLGPVLSNAKLNRLFFEGRDNLIQVDKDGNDVYDEQGNVVYLPNQGINYADVDFCFQGKGVCINVTSERDGKAGSYLLKMLASRFRILSGEREVLWKTATSEARSLPGYDPERDDLIPQDNPVYYVADEYQDLAMVGGMDMPVGDDGYWNKNRSKGVIGLIATQSVAALEQFMGEKEVANMLLNFRNKILLQTEDVKTIEYFIQLAGKTLRMKTFGKNYFERQSMRELVVGGVMQEPEFMLRDEDLMNLAVNDGDYDTVAPMDRMSHEQYNRYLQSVADAQAARTESLQDVGQPSATAIDIERTATDMEQKERSEGNEEQSLLNVRDVLGFSNSHAIIITQNYTQIHIEQIKLTSNFTQEAEWFQRQKMAQAA
jgi:hypothetical protein